MLEHASQIKGAIGDKIRANAGQIEMSKDLATIRTDVPLGEVDFDGLRRQPEDVDRLREIFTRMEFKMFLSRLGKGSVEAAKAPKEEAKPAPKGAGVNPLMGSLFDFVESDDAAAEESGAAAEVKQYSSDTAPSTTSKPSGAKWSGGQLLRAWAWPFTPPGRRRCAPPFRPLP